MTNLAGVPSIVYGLLALGLFVYKFGFGQSVLSAGLTLALLILPIIIVGTRESILRAVPKAIREAVVRAAARRTWQTVTKRPRAPLFDRRASSRASSSGLSRAIGETAPIITIGALSFIAFLPNSPISGEFAVRSMFEWIFKSEFTAMPIQIFNWVSRPEAGVPASTQPPRAAILLAMTLAMNAVAIWIRYRFLQEDQLVSGPP